jgi:ribosomal protein S18 acetylase RimI-like enzyme
LHDRDRAAVEELLLPTEARSLFLLGNARNAGIDDRGGRFGGVWIGAFEGERLCGLIAWVRGPNSITPACEGHAGVLVPALLEEIGREQRRMIVGTRERVDEVAPLLPPSWQVGVVADELLLTMPMAHFRPRPGDAIVVPAERAVEVAALRVILQQSSGLPPDPNNEAWAAEATAKSEVIGVIEDGRLVSMTCVATHTGRWLHVGATVTLPTHRRRGHAGACVTELIRRMRPEIGAALFTDETNFDAIGVYESLGFAVETSWRLHFYA